MDGDARGEQKRPMASLVDQLRGTTRLAVEATRAVTGLVQEMHHVIGGGPELLGRPFLELTKLLSDPAYDGIRSVTDVIDAGLELALEGLAPLLERAGVDRSALLAVLNGVLGDYLAETKNPLALPMELRVDGQPLALTPEALTARFPAGDRLLVLVHGSSADDTCWQRKGHDHGASLALACGFTPLALRYNSGLHVSQNGSALSLLLEQLVRSWPRPVRELVLLGHSMGGLVSRSACLEAEAQGHGWPAKLGALVTLGTPHHGAPLERGGNWVDVLLEGNRYSAPLAKLGRIRSAGVTDLRFGNVLEAHWAGRDRFEFGDDQRGPMTLPAGVRCYAVAATRSPKTTGDGLLGDGLVTVDSALGKDVKPERTLRFDETLVVPAAGHLDLLDRAEVAQQLIAWLGPAPRPRAG
jgi:pimeloyl-ACP methyl ester carboxylesterase